MNEIAFSKFIGEITTKGYDEIGFLVWFLHAKRSDGKPLPHDGGSRMWSKQLRVEPRYASSIVIRSEVELLGVSTPRFGFRVYLGDTKSFINCRRLRTLDRHVNASTKASQTTRQAKLKVFERHPLIIGPKNAGFVEIPVREGPCVADCLLLPPEYLPAEDYHLIKIPLFAEYGEEIPRNGETGQILAGTEAKERNQTNSPVCGVPYVKPLSVGGGLCSQVCCYIATTIHHKFASNIYGLGEITALASDDRWKELPIVGLNEIEMAKYFGEVNLRSIFQFLTLEDGRHKGKADREFRQALEAYARSEMPVILSVDINRLRGKDVDGQSIYERNGLQTTGRRLPSGPGSRYQPSIHSVVVVGCSNQRSIPDCEFPVVFHDSSTMPLLTATIHDLAQVGVSEATDNLMRHPTLLPVTPAAVKLPLLPWSIDKSRKDSRRGLLAISSLDWQPRFDDENRRFLLCQIDRINEVPILQHFPEPDAQNQIGPYLDKWKMIPWVRENLGWHHDHWVWLEFCGPIGVKIWDAELSPDSFGSNCDDPEHYLRGVISSDGVRFRLESRPANYGRIPVSTPKVISRMEIETIANRDQMRGCSSRELNQCQIDTIDAGLTVKHFRLSRDRAQITRLLSRDYMVPWAKSQFGWHHNHKVWVEICGPVGLKLWDAECEGEGENDLRLPNGIIRHDGTEFVLVNPRSNRANETTKASVGKDLFKPSVISSFDINGVANEFPEWPAQAKNVEVYTSMSQDIPTLLKQFQFSRAQSNTIVTATPVEAFANAYSDRKSDTIAKNFAERLGRILAGRQIIGFATFFPEILAKADSIGWQAADAIKFLVKVARELIPRGSHNPQFTIELVAGSRIEGIWGADITEPTTGVPDYVVNRITVDEAIGRLLKRLKPVAALAAETPGIQLAVELEPGPLFALSGAYALSTLCKRISDLKGGAISKVVALNFDLPHWAFLAKIPLPWLYGETDHGTLSRSDGERIRRRIIHCHVSDHMNGHFCDNVIGIHHSREEYLRWLRFVDYVASEDREADLPRFSGYASCEMEVCKSLSFVADSFNNLQNLIALVR